MTSTGKKPARRGASSRFRIVAGRWRGRRLAFEPRPSLRPTPDRVRETLYNWLAPLIQGARCLDLYAGSGALGLEALSRGAGSVVFVDSDGPSCRRIREHLTTLECAQGDVINGDSLRYLRGEAQPFDLVLLDPPFASGVTGELCTLLVEGGWLSARARVYIEYPRGATPDVGPRLQILRTARAGRVEYALLALVSEG